MPVVDTVQTFNTGDTVTSTTLNNIMDQSVFVAGAVVSGSGLAITAGGQMTTSGIPGANVTDGTISQAKLSSNVVGNGPAFRAYPASSQSIPTATDTKVNFATEEYDTNSNFSSSRFTPTVAGYYLIKGSVGYAASRTSIACFIYKGNASTSTLYSSGNRISGTSNVATACDIVYLNGSTDWVEIWTRHTEGVSVGTDSSSNATNFSGCLIRSA